MKPHIPLRPLMLAAALFIGLHAPSAAAQTTDSVSEGSDVVITGQRLEDLVFGFVNELAPDNPRAEQLSRWFEWVCPGVVGLNAAQAQAIVDRIAVHAMSVGLNVGEPGCRANLLVIVTSDADAVARFLDEEHRNDMGYNRRNTLGREAFEEFVGQSRPVRWWHVSVSATEDGSVATNAGSSPGVSRIRHRRIGRSAVESRSYRLQEVFAAAILLVDARQVEGTSVATLGDYLAMASLAQIDPQADTTGFPSILNAFEGGPARPTRLMDWDTAYLEALYGAPYNQRIGGQTRDIAASILSIER